MRIHFKILNCHIKLFLSDVSLHIYSKELPTLNKPIIFIVCNTLENFFLNFFQLKGGMHFYVPAEFIENEIKCIGKI